MTSLLEFYHYVNTEIADPRTNNWMFVGSPIPIVLIILLYLVYVLKYGPRYMKDRPPYKFHTFIRIYNIFQIVANAWIVYEIFDAGWYQDYFIYCTKYDDTPSSQNLKFAAIVWYVFCLKIVDFVETILFVLRKKQRQVSFLHLYHHTSTVFFSWLYTKYFITGMIMLTPIINCSVHVVMYTYYLLSTFGPKLQKLTSAVKPAVTIVQIIQFWILILYALRAFIPGCPGVKIPAAIGIANITINLILFLNFYKQNYMKQAKQE